MNQALLMPELMCLYQPGSNATFFMPAGLPLRSLMIFS